MWPAKLPEIPDRWTRKTDAKQLQYGTAGFRDRVEELCHVMLRMGLLAGVRAVEVGRGVGIMITASHNPESDNGVKIVDPMGNMLDVSYETLASDLANKGDEDVLECVRSIASWRKLDISSLSAARVLCGYDTRKSSPDFHDAVKFGVEALGIQFCSLGIVTTPQLHFIVRCTNDPSYGLPTEEGYYEKLTSSFQKLNQNVSTEKYNATVYIDAANGVGGPKMSSLSQKISSLLNVTVLNNGRGKLNLECGADFVKIRQCAPTISGSSLSPKMGERWASFDGDADRIIYFYLK